MTLNSTQPHLGCDSLLCYRCAREGKRNLFKCSVRIQNSKLNFLIRHKISLVGAHAEVRPMAHGGRSCSWALSLSLMHNSRIFMRQLMTDKTDKKISMCQHQKQTIDVKKKEKKYARKNH